MHADDAEQAPSNRRPIRWGWWVAITVASVAYVWAMIAFLMRGGGLWQAVATTLFVAGNAVWAWLLWRRDVRRATEGHSLAASDGQKQAPKRWIIPLLIVGVLMIGLSLWLVYG